MNKKIKYKKTPTKTLKKSCDELWSLIVRTSANNICEICKKTEYLNAHHLISRKVLKYRHCTSNGICLCAGCHNFNDMSPHLFYWNFEKWLKENRPEKYANHVKQREDITLVKSNYEEVYSRLEEEFKAITGENFRMSRLHQYTMFKNADNINAMHVHQGESVQEIADKFGISKNMMKKFMTDNKIL